MSVEKTPESERRNEGPEQGAQAVIEGQRVEVRDQLLGHHQLISAIKALFGGKDARSEVIASFPPDRLDGLQRMVGKNGQDSLHKAIIHERNKAFAKQLEALGYEVKIIHPDTVEGGFLIKCNKEVSEEELLEKITPVAQNLGIEAKLNTTKIPFAGGGILVTFEYPETD